MWFFFFDRFSKLKTLVPTYSATQFLIWRATLFPRVVRRRVFITGGVEVTDGAEPAVVCGKARTMRNVTGSSWVSRGGQTSFITAGLFGCQRRAAERRDARGKTSLCKLPCAVHPVPQQCLLCKLPSASFQNLRPPSVTFQTEQEGKKWQAGVLTVKLDWWYPLQMRCAASEA